MSKKDIVVSENGLCADECRKIKHINKVEDYIVKCKIALNDGKGIVSDVTYNTLIDYLRLLHKDSPLLSTAYVIDKDSVDFSEELDRLLLEHPIYTIPKVNSVRDSLVLNFKGKLYDYPTRVFCVMRLKGCSVRVIYKDGVLVKATTRDSGRRGIDITRQLVALLGKKNKNFKGRGLVELRGDVVLPISKLKEAKLYVDDLRNSVSIVMSLLERGASDDCINLLDVLFSDIIGDMYSFEDMVSKYQYMDTIGLKTSLAIVDTVEKYSLEEDLLRIIGKMEVYDETYDYPTDSIMVIIDNIDRCKSFGIINNYKLGAIEIKDGKWSDIVYSGKISLLKWESNGDKKEPVAILQESVLLEEGVEIDRVPLYAPCCVLMLESYRGRLIHFRYMGNLGVVPCDKKGNMLINTLLD